MARFQITCTVLSDDKNKIAKIGLVDDGSPADAYSYVLTPEKFNSIIQDGHTCFFVNEDGQKVDVAEFVDEFIRTVPDEIKHNNLRELPHLTI